MLSAALLAGFGLDALSLSNLTVLLMLACGLFVFLGHYRLLDGMAKLVVVALTFSTLVALLLALGKGPVMQPGFEAPSPWTWASFGFLIMLMGWMPAPLDLSAWSSLWMFSRERQTGHTATMRETLIDFHLGYLMAVVMAVVFLALGALVMYGSGEHFSESGIGFSKQLIELYSRNIGAWSHGLILFAAFVTMLSTTLTCVDGYPRALAACTTLLLPRLQPRFGLLHQGWMILALAGATVIVLVYVQNLLHLLGFAAIISFVTSPILAVINFLVMRGANVPERYRPGPLLSLLSWLGILFFFVMTAGFVYAEFIAD
jgi:Mn2+/Fe2+ NRAMP family transporter